MKVYLFNMVFLSIFGYSFLVDGEKEFFKVYFKKPKKVFCFLAALAWIFISGFRGWSVGADTLAYKDNFDRILRSSWDDLWTNFIDVIFKDGKGKDPGYALLEKVFQIFSENYQAWLVFIAIVF